MLGGLVTVVAPTAAVVSIGEVKEHARIDISDDDLQVSRKIAEATALVEDYCSLALLTQTLDWTFDAFPDVRELGVRRARVLELPRSPLASVTSLTTTNEAGTTAVLSSGDYYLDTASHPGRLCLKAAAAWPTDLRDYAGITVRFVAGWTSVTAVPAALVEAVLHIVAWSYGFRGDDLVGGTLGQATKLPPSVYEKMAPYRIGTGIG